EFRSTRRPSDEFGGGGPSTRVSVPRSCGSPDATAAVVGGDFAMTGNRGRGGCRPLARGAPLLTLPSPFLPSARGGHNPRAAPPPPKVPVAYPLQQPFTRYLEVTGNAAAVNSVDLVARVQGFLQEIHYNDGDAVKQGALLFTIEPEPYRVKLDQA